MQADPADSEPLLPEDPELEDPELADPEPDEPEEEPAEEPEPLELEPVGVGAAGALVATVAKIPPAAGAVGELPAPPVTLAPDPEPEPPVGWLELPVAHDPDGAANAAVAPLSFCTFAPGSGNVTSLSFTVEQPLSMLALNMSGRAS